MQGNSHQAKDYPTNPWVSQVVPTMAHPRRVSANQKGAGFHVLLYPVKPYSVIVLCPTATKKLSLTKPCNPEGLKMPCVFNPRSVPALLASHQPVAGRARTPFSPVFSHTKTGRIKVQGALPVAKLHFATGKKK